MSEYDEFVFRTILDYRPEGRESIVDLDHYGTIHERIVRCRDCAYYETDELGDYCTLMGFEDVKSMADMFCAWGEQRGDAE